MVKVSSSLSISLSIDQILSQQTVDFYVVGGALDKALTLWQILMTILSFRFYYQIHLADRLLCGTYSKEVEFEVLLNLKPYYYPHYLDKQRAMIYDIRSSDSDEKVQ